MKNNVKSYLQYNAVPSLNLLKNNEVRDYKDAAVQTEQDQNNAKSYKNVSLQTLDFARGQIEDTKIIPGTSQIQENISQPNPKNVKEVIPSYSKTKENTWQHTRISTTLGDKPLKTYSRKRLHEDEIVVGQRENVKFVKYTPSSQSTRTVPKNIVDYPDTASSTKSIIKKKSIVLTSLEKKLKAQKNEYLRLKKKANLASKNFFAHLLTGKSTAVKTLINMQLSPTKKKFWTTNERHLALSFYYKSPACYKFLREELRFSLPSIRTIQS
ncbi:uncharacterized protein LOC126740745 [Anthonomus grandis grandis]|uniref:uncharacterized protein LOC126740745 n=1 Tax=Anthonomus grandis grandis TaxID=2921223 RepID=UPI002165B50F|nr:uncharacterized protein LOC126740745 [Anthonomus grandis grandis]